MPKQIKLNELEEKIVIFQEMYDAVRIVDPTIKSVLELNNKNMKETAITCYKYWKCGCICNNCISVRAYQENKTYMKLEQKEESCIMITAIPVSNSERPVVVELMKNITDMMLIGDGEDNEHKSITEVLSDMNHLAIKDHLTEAYNRRFVDERLTVDLIRADLANNPLSIIFIDLDNMKLINDTYGHQIGDLALKQVVNDMQLYIDDSKDWVARYGGDEFIICLNNSDNKESHILADKMIRQIKEHIIKVSQCHISISVSYGIYTVKNEMLSVNEIINRADQEMYKMKKERKNNESL